MCVSGEEMGEVGGPPVPTNPPLIPSSLLPLSTSPHPLDENKEWNKQPGQQDLIEDDARTCSQRKPGTGPRQERLMMMMKCEGKDISHI